MTTWQAHAHNDRNEYPHRLVIQISSGDHEVHARAINEAALLKRLLGVNNVDIAIVTFGPGIDILTKASHHTRQIRNLMLQGASFYACDTTLKHEYYKHGKPLELLHGVNVIDNGIEQVMSLQEKGYVYLSM
ncbi:MAG: DsrE family protein [Sedimenticola sp.]